MLEGVRDAQIVTSRLVHRVDLCPLSNIAFADHIDHLSPNTCCTWNEISRQIYRFTCMVNF